MGSRLVTPTMVTDTSTQVKLLIQTCHKRGVHAMGGMAAQIPIKDDKEANDKAMDGVRADKLREVRAGHDGYMTYSLVPHSNDLLTTGVERGLLTPPWLLSPPRSSTSTCPRQTSYSCAGRMFRLARMTS